MGDCPVGHANDVPYEDVTEQYNKCPIAYEYDGGALGDCRKCGQPYDYDPQTYMGCSNAWVVCGDCLSGNGCVMHQSQLPELPEARVGEVKWEVAR